MDNAQYFEDDTRSLQHVSFLPKKAPSSSCSYVVLFFFAFTFAPQESERSALQSLPLLLDHMFLGINDAIKNRSFTLTEKHG